MDHLSDQDLLQGDDHQPEEGRLSRPRDPTRALTEGDARRGERALGQVAVPTRD